MVSAKCANWMVGLGATLAVLVSVFMGCGQPIYNAAVDGVLVLEEGKTIMDAFITPPVPIYMSFHFFNLTNPRDVQYYGAKPNLVEVGPYIYEEVREKINMEFSADGESVKYLQTKTYFWREELNPGRSQTDRITTANVVMVMLAAMSHNVSKIGLIWPEIERTMDVFQSFSVSEALFEGWELPKFNFNFGKISKLNGTLYDIMVALEIPAEKIPEIVQSNRIGYQSFANGTTDGLYKVSTGKADISTYINVLEWENETALSWWGDPYCDMINGTDGTQFPPRSISETTTVRIFVTELCRSLYLDYESDLDYFGVPAQRFVPPAEMLQSPTLNEANKCFVSGLGDLPSSMMEMAPCFAGLPVIMSTPHFFDGDDKFEENYVGLEPIREDHITYLDIQTDLGVPVRAHKRIQVNLPLQKYGHLTSFMNFESLLIYPVMWADESAELSVSDSETLKKALTLPFTIIYSVGGVLLLGSLIMLGVGLKKRHELSQTV